MAFGQILVLLGTGIGYTPLHPIVPTIHRWCKGVPLDPTKKMLLLSCRLKARSQKRLETLVSNENGGWF